MHRHEQAESGLAHAPHAGLRGRVELGHGGVAGAGAEEVPLDPGELFTDALFVLAERFDQEHGAGLALHEVGQRGVAGGGAAALDDDVVDELDRGGIAFARDQGALGGLDEGAEMGGEHAASLGQLGEPDRRLCDDGERALGADDELGEVGGIGVEQRFDVVAGDAAGDVGEALGDFAAVLVGDGAEFGEQAAFGPSGVEQAAQLGAFAAGELEAGAVGEHDRDGVDHVDGLAVEAGMGAAGVVADAAADGGAVGGGGIDRVVQPVLAGGLVEFAEHEAGLDAGRAGVGVDLGDAVHPAGEVEHDGVVHALAGEAGAGAAGEDGDAAGAGHVDGGRNIGGAAGEDDRDRFHLVEGRIGGEEQARGSVDQDVGGVLDGVAEIVGERAQSGGGVAEHAAGALDAGVARGGRAFEDGAWGSFGGHGGRVTAGQRRAGSRAAAIASAAARIVRAAPAGLSAARMPERTATPWAPAAMAKAALAAVMPPIA